MQFHSLQYHGSVGICHSYQFGINGYKWNGKEFAIWYDIPRPSWIVNVNTAFAFMRDVERMSLVSLSVVWVLLFIVHNSSSIA